MARRPVLSRRNFLNASAIGLGGALLAPSRSRAQTVLADLRGSMDAATYGVRPGTVDSQSAAFQLAINQAAADGKPLFLPAGDYLVSNIDLPSGLSSIGVPGRSRIRYAGDGHLLLANEVNNLRLQGLVIEGDNRRMAGYAPALLHISTGTNIAIEDCQFLGSAKDGVVFDRMEGRIERCQLSGARGAAIVSNDGQGIAIRDNVVTDCADNGILVHRWSAGHDGTQIIGNRIARIGARSDGTGSFGNGIHAFRADDVMIANNTIRDCVFSAVRCFAASNVQIVNILCAASGESGLDVEFGSEGAVIANNVVDDAANGISVGSLSEGGRMAVVQGNLVRNLRLETTLPTDWPTYGTGISVAADTTVVANVVENAPYAGIRAGFGPNLRNVIISQNIVRHASMGVTVSVVDGVGPSIIRDNIFEDTLDGAVIGMHGWDRATGDLAKTDDVPPPLLVENNSALS
ncbi:MAG: TIGR03808 family TAT-translocated repetitive protein [Cohaesibacteraceae bacterium]